MSEAIDPAVQPLLQPHLEAVTRYVEGRRGEERGGEEGKRGSNGRRGKRQWEEGRGKEKREGQGVYCVFQALPSDLWCRI